MSDDQDPEDVILFTSPEFQSALAYPESKLIRSAELLKIQFSGGQTETSVCQGKNSRQRQITAA
ncbi:MAG: hypothetical protein HS115_11875 [Spirochaetales bacterium]|nr:hypothetical protein [Spirochaetales bacterium]